MYNNFPQHNSGYNNHMMNTINSSNEYQFNQFQAQVSEPNVFYRPEQGRDFQEQSHSMNQYVYENQMAQEDYHNNYYEPEDFRHEQNQDYMDEEEVDDQFVHDNNWAYQNEREYQNQQPGYIKRGHQSEVNLHQIHHPHNGNVVNQRMNRMKNSRPQSMQNIHDFQRFHEHQHGQQPYRHGMTHAFSKKSLNAGPMSYYNNESSPQRMDGGGDGLSVRSLQQNMYLNRYEDDCLYMNLEEEYLHKVSKRTGKGNGVSINKSMYNY
jgi:hypothetical protein